MNKIITQIYEIQDVKEAAAMIEIGVDHIGSVILNEKEWKQPSIFEVVKLVKRAGRVSSLIPLFNKTETVFRVIDYYEPSIVHFVEALVDKNGGKESYGNLLELQNVINERYPEVEIMRSISVPEPSNKIKIPVLEIAKDFESLSDYFLTDTWLGNEHLTGSIGITGKTCNWGVAAELVKKSRVPVILAGGLSEKNVKEAVKKVKPFGVDSCTQTNTVDKNGKPVRFKKDIRKVKSFVENAKSAKTGKFSNHA